MLFLLFPLISRWLRLKRNANTVSPDYQAAFDDLQKETIDFVRSNDKVIYSIHQTIEQLQHLVVVVKLRNKAKPVAAKYQENRPSTGSVHALPSLTAKSSVVEDIAKIIEIYNQLYYTMDRINSTAIKNLDKLGIQDIFDDEDTQWYRVSTIQKAEAADFAEEAKALKSLSDIAIAQGKTLQVAPKTAPEMVLSDEEKVWFFFLICSLIVVYILWYKADSASEGTA
ncbi:uncharacterized protein ATC70_009397 [Mucor velutinosus]|uniref:Uncharacterized protein n=1 Tax=Mucor velutinosus TaxID=708070 RepID=A0AAN7DQP3_9FUNG|nr:hypothetical protein ATC70_009397 [Mucor velutinosus]